MNYPGTNATGKKLALLYLTAFSLVLAAALWGTLAVAAPSSQPTARPAAATIAVTSTADASDSDLADGICDDGTGACTLRAAIEQSASGDGITMPAGTYTLTEGVELHITKSLTLSGAGSGDTFIQAATGEGIATHRVFQVNGGDVSITGVTIRHGKNTGSTVGGGILNTGPTTLTVSNSTITDNTSGFGGGLHNNSALSVVDSTISNNSSLQDGAGIWNNGTLTVTRSTISDNASSGDGGGIWNEGTGDLVDATIRGNTGDGSGGGIRSNGGGIYNEGHANPEQQYGEQQQ